MRIISKILFGVLAFFAISAAYTVIRIATDKQFQQGALKATETLVDGVKSAYKEAKERAGLS